MVDRRTRFSGCKADGRIDIEQTRGAINRVTHLQPSLRPLSSPAFARATCRQASHNRVGVRQRALFLDQLGQTKVVRCGSPPTPKKDVARLDVPMQQPTLMA